MIISHLFRLTLVASVIVLISCNKEEEEKKIPVACFTHSIYDSSVSFNSSCSKYASTYLWDFGNGETSIAPNPTFDFEGAGYYQVTLQISGANGNDTESKTIVIDEECVECYCSNDTGGGSLGGFCGTSQEVSDWCNSTCSMGPEYTCNCN